MALKIDTREYFSSTGKQPRGWGVWAFDYATEDHQANTYPQIFTPHSMSYSDAKKWALAEAKKLKATWLNVLP
jgi:hypothetical protein